MGDSDCSETVADEDVPPTTSPALLQPPSPKTPPINGAGFKSPAHKSPVGVTGVKQGPAVGTPDRHYRPLERAREKQTEAGRIPEVRRLECVGTGTGSPQMRAMQSRNHGLRLVTVQE